MPERIHVNIGYCTIYSLHDIALWYTDCFAQLNYMRRQSLGVKTDQILVIKFPGPTEGMKTKMEAMRKAIRKLPLASKVTCSGAVPGEEVAMFYPIIVRMMH